MHNIIIRHCRDQYVNQPFKHKNQDGNWAINDAKKDETFQKYLTAVFQLNHNTVSSFEIEIN